MASHKKGPQELSDNSFTSDDRNEIQAHMIGSRDVSNVSNVTIASDDGNRPQMIAWSVKGWKVGKQCFSRIFSTVCSMARCSQFMQCEENSLQKEKFREILWKM